jgi:hypothetical protein
VEETGELTLRQAERDNRVRRYQEVPGVLDIDGEATPIGRDLTDRPELLLAVGNERLKTDLNLLAHEDLLS